MLDIILVKPAQRPLPPPVFDWESPMRVLGASLVLFAWSNLLLLPGNNSLEAGLIIVVVAVAHGHGRRVPLPASRLGIARGVVAGGIRLVGAVAVSRGLASLALRRYSMSRCSSIWPRANRR